MRLAVSCCLYRGSCRVPSEIAPGEAVIRVTLESRSDKVGRPTSLTVTLR